MLIPVRTNTFKRMERRGKDLGKLRDLLTLLLEQKPLPEKHRDHLLKGIGPASVMPISSRTGY